MNDLLQSKGHSKRATINGLVDFFENMNKLTNLKINSRQSNKWKNQRTKTKIQLKIKSKEQHIPKTNQEDQDQNQKQTQNPEKEKEKETKKEKKEENWDEHFYFCKQRNENGLKEEDFWDEQIYFLNSIPYSDSNDSDGSGSSSSYSSYHSYSSYNSTFSDSPSESSNSDNLERTKKPNNKSPNLNDVEQIGSKYKTDSQNKSKTREYKADLESNLVEKSQKITLKIDDQYLENLSDPEKGKIENDNGWKFILKGSKKMIYDLRKIDPIQEKKKYLTYFSILEHELSAITPMEIPVGEELLDDCIQELKLAIEIVDDMIADRSKEKESLESIAQLYMKKKKLLLNTNDLMNEGITKTNFLINFKSMLFRNWAKLITREKITDLSHGITKTDVSNDEKSILNFSSGELIKLETKKYSYLSKKKPKFKNDKGKKRNAVYGGKGKKQRTKKKKYYIIGYRNNQKGYINQSAIHTIKVNIFDETIFFKKRIKFPTPKISKNINWKYLSLFDIDPEEAARQITLREFQTFSKIDFTEFLNQSWNKKDLYLRAQNVRNMINRFNNFSFWCCTMILQAQKLYDRARNVEYFITLAEHLKNFHNYNSLMAIISSLHSLTISRLKHTMFNVSEPMLDKLDSLDSLLSTECSFKEYRKDLVNAYQNGQSAIPFLGIHLTDLTFLDEMNKNETDDDTDISKEEEDDDDSDFNNGQYINNKNENEKENENENENKNENEKENENEKKNENENDNEKENKNENEKNNKLFQNKNEEKESELIKKKKKMRGTVKMLMEFLKFQLRPYNLKAIPQLQEYFEKYPSLNEDKLYQLSLQREPKGVSYEDLD
ncbi:guanine nucleotide exchange factor [Anaeramoeba flamelloides]|uniref:Guanine nucleotide exchange factor n=1 Tax=Anaeramoeba flamelloides TaxID=1746091 RepID=A0ABQ8X8A9_9EUKA|nr:guanine nucleotide exchange factor [Anaeramoeba flamelloides]